MSRHSKEEKFLLKLLTACRQHDAYSVSEICQYFGIPYHEVKEWTINNKHWQNILEDCHAMCACNANLAGMMGRIPAEEALKYMGK